MLNCTSIFPSQPSCTFLFQWKTWCGASSSHQVSSLKPFKQLSHQKSTCWVEDYRLANYFEIKLSFGLPIECFEMRFFSQRGHIQCSWSCGSSKKMKHWFLHPSQYSSESSSESSAQLRDMKEDVFCHFWRCWQYFTWHSF